MNELLRFGGAVFGVFLALLAALFLATRLYIHSFKNWTDSAQSELRVLQAELETLKKRVNVAGEGRQPKEELESA